MWRDSISGGSGFISSIPSSGDSSSLIGHIASSGDGISCLIGYILLSGYGLRLCGGDSCVGG